MSYSSKFSNIYAQNYAYANGNSIWQNVVANTITSIGNTNIGGNAVIQGNLVVVGNIYQQEQLSIANVRIIVASNANSSLEATGAGLQVGNANYASFLWDDSTNTWHTGAGNISADYFIGNGALLTGLDFTNYSNANAAAYLASNAAVTILTTANITTAANVQASYLLGNIRSATGGYDNSNVAAYLPTYTGNLASLAGNVITTANVQADYILGNGAFLTGLSATYGNGDVANYLASNANLTIAVGTGNITTQGYFIGNGALLTGISTSGYSNANVANYLVSVPTVTVGFGAGTNNVSSIRSVAIGYAAGIGSTGNANAQQGTDAVAIGTDAGAQGQGTSAVAIGDGAGQTNQSYNAVAIGVGAGTTRQKNDTVAIGPQSGATDQGAYAVALGYQAGLFGQGQNAVAIGSRAGQISQPNNSIVINATGNTLSGDTANALYIDPVRYDANASGNVLFYDVNSKEVTAGPSYSDTDVAEFLASYTGNATFGNVTVLGNTVIEGNLRVQGNTTYINVEDLVIDDYLIIIGNAATQASDLNGAGIQIGNLDNGNVQLVYSYPANVVSLNVGANIANVLNVEGNVITTGYFLGDGSLLANLPAGNYSNANVYSLLASNANLPIITKANVTANYFIGNGSLLTGLPSALTVSLIDSANVITNAVPSVEFLRFDANSGFGVEDLGNGNVKISLGSTFKTWVIGNSDPNQPNLVASGEDIVQFVQGNGIVFTSNNTPTGNAYKSLTIDVDFGNFSGDISTSGNISGNYILGNGALLTGLPATYSNANVAAYLPNYQGLISNIEFRSTSPAAAAIISNDKSLILGGNLLSYVILPDDGNANVVAAELTNHGLGNVIISSGPADYEWVFDNAGNLFAPGNIDAGNVVSANYFIGNGALLTDVTVDLGNITIDGGNISVNTANGNLGLSGNGTGYVLLGNVIPWIPGFGPANAAVDLGSPTYQFRTIYGNVVEIANTVIQEAPTGNTGVRFADATTGFLSDITAGTIYTESIYIDVLAEAGTLNVIGNILGNNANIVNELKVGGYANFLGNLKAENIAAVTNIEAQYYYGNGYYLTGLNAANLIGAYSNADVANYLPIYNGNILASNLTVSNNVIIQGNLQVLGNTTTIEANSLIISDKDITVANGAVTASQANGAGLIVGAGNIANIVYLSTPNYWSIYPGVYTAGNVAAEGNVTASGDVSANNVSIGNVITANTGNFTCCLVVGGATTTYFNAYTTSSAANQVLYEANAASSAQLDFNIIATDPTLMGGSRQSSKLLTTTYGNSTDFVEYGGVYINTPVGDFAVDQANGNVRLLVSPQSNANITYSVLVTRLI